MKYFSIITLLLGVAYHSVCMGQTIIKDTIYISKNTMSHLVFTESIAMADYGSTALVTSSQDKKKIGAPVINALSAETQIVSIKANKKFRTPTNISVITHTNIYYDISCIYSDMPVNNYYYFDPNNKLNPVSVDTVISTPSIDPEAIDEEVVTAIQKDSLAETKIAKYYGDTIRYKGIAKKIYSTKTKKVKFEMATIEKITLKLIGVYTLKDKTYLKVSIHNNGSIPFIIDAWEYTFRKKGGYDPQEAPMQNLNPIYECNANHNRIVPKDKLTKVFVFDTFSLDSYLSFYVQLKEKGQQRSPILEINNKYINKAFPVQGN